MELLRIISIVLVLVNSFHIPLENAHSILHTEQFHAVSTYTQFMTQSVIRSTSITQEVVKVLNLNINYVHSKELI